jgi:hypothetical protein
LRTEVAIDLATVASQNLLYFRRTSAFLDGYQASALRESIVVSVRDLKRSADTVPFCEAAVARARVAILVSFISLEEPLYLVPKGSIVMEVSCC